MVLEVNRKMLSKAPVLQDQEVSNLKKMIHGQIRHVKTGLLELVNDPILFLKPK